MLTVIEQQQEPGESTSPYARANMQLPTRQKRSFGKALKDMWASIAGRKHTVSGIPGENGARIIHINNKQLNGDQHFLHNGVTTGKYNAFTFLPKFLYEEFSKYANLFFLFVTCIQVKKKND
jgi:phospholipid-transporting ATPase